MCSPRGAKKGWVEPGWGTLPAPGPERGRGRRAEESWQEAGGWEGRSAAGPRSARGVWVGRPAGKKQEAGGVRDPEDRKAPRKKQRVPEPGARGGDAHRPGRRAGGPRAARRTAHFGPRIFSTSCLGGLLFRDLTGSVWLRTARAARRRRGKARGRGVGSLSHWQ